VTRSSLAAAVVVFVLGGVPGAAAQERVEGGGSFNDAPLVGPGTYRDSIRNNEFTFYAVEVADGQRLEVRARLVSAPGQEPLNGAIALAFYSPWRVRDLRLGPSPVTLIGPTGAVSRMRAVSPSIGGGDGDANQALLYRDPGRYYFGFINTVVKQRIEHPLRFTVAVTGGPGNVEPAPEPTPSIAGTPGVMEPEPTEPPDSPPDVASDPPEPEGDYGGLVRLGLACLLGGFAAGAGAGLLRRRS
jgi:Ca-activated chloride channel homolog